MHKKKKKKRFHQQQQKNLNKNRKNIKSNQETNRVDH